MDSAMAGQSSRPKLDDWVEINLAVIQTRTGLWHNLRASATKIDTSEVSTLLRRETDARAPRVDWSP